MKRLRRREFIGRVARAGVAAGAGVLWPRGAKAGGTSTAQRAAVLARALSYEQTLERRAGKRVDILLVHDGTASTRGTADQWNAAFASLSGVKVDGRSIAARVASVADDLPEIFSRGDVDVAIACGDVSPSCVETIRALTRGTSSLSVATRRPQVESGLTLGILAQDGKIKIVVNLRAAQKESIRFSAKLLKLAEILR